METAGLKGNLSGALVPPTADSYTRLRYSQFDNTPEVLA